MTLGTDEISQRWKVMGFKWQIAAELLLKTIGYRILKSQHRSPNRRWTREKLPRLSDDSELDNYLWSYADYIVAADHQVSLVEVKSQPYLVLKVKGEMHEIRDGNVSFTWKELLAYRSAKIPILVLLLQYCDCEDLRQMGPVYYRVIPFEDFQFRPNWTGGTPADGNKPFEIMNSDQALGFFRRARALRVVDIGPGFVRLSQGRSG